MVCEEKYYAPLTIVLCKVAIEKEANMAGFLKLMGSAHPERTLRAISKLKSMPGQTSPMELGAIKNIIAKNKGFALETPDVLSPIYKNLGDTTTLIKYRGSSGLRQPAGFNLDGFAGYFPQSPWVSRYVGNGKRTTVGLVELLGKLLRRKAQPAGTPVGPYAPPKMPGVAPGTPGNYQWMEGSGFGRFPVDHAGRPRGYPTQNFLNYFQQ